MTLENSLDSIETRLFNLLTENEDIDDEIYMVLIESAFQNIRLAKKALRGVSNG